MKKYGKIKKRLVIYGKEENRKKLMKNIEENMNKEILDKI